jgi:DNA polymerase-4
MKKRIILHIDMNSYFASVEQQANPFLRGRAVGICAYNSPNGVIIASSAEAKAKGIKTGCKVGDAKTLDPNVVILENEPAKYRSTTESIFKILAEYTDTVEPYSIDEAFLDLSGWVPDFLQAEKIGREIQARIKKEVGDYLNSSIGISWTKFLAKFAGDIAPKRSILVVSDQEKLISLLDNRPLQDAWGINIRTEAHLKALGINNLLELKNFNKNIIRRVLGRPGYYLWANVNGLEINSVSRGNPVSKTIGHSYCIPRKTNDKKYLGQVLFKLCEKTGRRLRNQGLDGQLIQVFFAYTRGGGVGKCFKTPDKIFTTKEIFHQAESFLDKIEFIMPVRMVAVSVGRLAPVSSQMSLFEDNLSKKSLSTAMDKLNDKYGEYTVVAGRMFGAEKIARDRIGFRKTMNVEL